MMEWFHNSKFYNSKSFNAKAEPNSVVDQSGLDVSENYVGPENPEMMGGPEQPHMMGAAPQGHHDASNNMMNSLIEACIKFSVSLNIACPKDYQPNKALISWIKKKKGKVKIFNNKLKPLLTISAAFSGLDIITFKSNPAENIPSLPTINIAPLSVGT